RKSSDNRPLRGAGPEWNLIALFDSSLLSWNRVYVTGTFRARRTNRFGGEVMTYEVSCPMSQKGRCPSYPLIGPFR
ncbi:MAG: hypothetical protein KAW89_01480, partial [Armatimonadetes bacterium]|nr:hypothetical protein [Armatimonadota bacterium]